MRKAYKFRIYPNKTQVEKMDNALNLCRELYNAALQERRDAWKINRINITCFDQINQLPAIKTVRPDLVDVYSRVFEEAIRSVDKSFKAFFRRVKQGQKPGFPRFKPSQRFNSFTYSRSGFWLNENNLKLSKIGEIKLKLSRPVIGKIKTCIIKREIDKWFVVFTVETLPEPLPKTGEVVGVDMGIENFATLSNGTQIDNWKYYESSQKGLRRAQRSLARKKKGSANRKKAVLKLRKIHQKIINRRSDFQHKVSTNLVKSFDVICIEKLNILGMSKGILAKQVRDVAWYSFFQKLKYKAENAGKTVVEVNPAGTSQTCICGERVEKTLAQRWHHCLKCGYSNHRDIVSAQIILSLGLSDLALTKAVGL